MTDYNPKLWGNAGWTFMEYTALAYPDDPSEEQKKFYKTFYENMQNTLPCSECRINYSLHLVETPIDEYLKNSYSLFEWVTIMKNKVNRLQGKDQKDHEVERKDRFRKNLALNGKPCCGAGKFTKRVSTKEKKERVRSLKSTVEKRKELIRQNRERRRLRKLRLL